MGRALLLVNARKVRILEMRLYGDGDLRLQSFGEGFGQNFARFQGTHYWGKGAFVVHGWLSIVFIYCFWLFIVGILSTQVVAIVDIVDYYCVCTCLSWKLSLLLLQCLQMGFISCLQVEGV